MSALNGFAQPWRRVERSGLHGFASGCSRSIDELLALEPERLKKQGSAVLLDQDGQFGLAVEGRGQVFACVDAIRSYPLFYRLTEGVIRVAGSPRLLLDADTDTTNPTSLLEMYHAGYVTGDNTIFEGVKQLEAGCALHFDSVSQVLTKWKYWNFRPANESTKANEAELLAELEEIFQTSFARLMDRASGRRICLPLSGGLDSRLIACKLHEQGVHDVLCVSYGPPGNPQAATAREIAGSLGYDWKFVAFEVGRMRDIYHSRIREEYGEYADGLSSLPSFPELWPMIWMRESFPHEDLLIVNGQSGDFISGNHMPATLQKDADYADLWAHVREKHFGVWDPVASVGEFELIESRFREWFRSYADGDNDLDYAGAHDTWEYCERQAKYVVNGQRLYEFLGYDWLLPLWDPEVIRFFERIPREHYLGRKLLRNYLSNWDYKGLFSITVPAPKGHVGLEGRFWELGLNAARRVGWPAGVLRRLGYYRTGYYKSLFQLYPFHEYLRRVEGTRVSPQARSGAGLLISQWFEDRGLADSLALIRQEARERTGGR